MISSGDARAAVDLGDCYAIEPDFVEYPRLSFKGYGGKAVVEEFVYSSDGIMTS